MDPAVRPHDHGIELAEVVPGAVHPRVKPQPCRRGRGGAHGDTGHEQGDRKEPEELCTGVEMDAGFR